MTDPKTQAVPLASPEETAARRSEQEQEYGTYVANQVIYANGVVAYNPGAPVPVSNAERLGYVDQGLVYKINTKQGQDFIRQLHEAATAQVSQPAPPPVSLSVPVPQDK